MTLVLTMPVTYYRGARGCCAQNRPKSAISRAQKITQRTLGHEISDACYVSLLNICVSSYTDLYSPYPKVLSVKGCPVSRPGSVRFWSKTAYKR